MGVGIAHNGWQPCDVMDYLQSLSATTNIY